MSMSYDHTGDGMIPLVETFQYHDTFGPPPVSLDLAVEPSGAGGRTGAAAVKPIGVTQPENPRSLAEAHAQGMALGIRQATARFEEELAQERKRFSDLAAEFRRQCSDYYAKAEIELVQLALSIAAKILHRESQIDPLVVAGLVKVMLERLQQKSKVVVRIPPGDMESWRPYFREQSYVQIVPDPSLPPKACFLETELGVADMGLESQLKEVEQGFFDLLARRPEAK